ncbi:hypothetical protein EBQ90_12430 [bacterium]|nr:hypothetical protein [bacterium]
METVHSLNTPQDRPRAQVSLAPALQLGQRLLCRAVRCGGCVEKILLGLCLLAVLGCQKKETEAVSNLEILNGNPIASSEYPSVGLIKGANFICTGTLISSDVVLTAGHCVVDSSGNLTQLKFTLDSNYSTASNWTTVSSIKRNASKDIAIVKLATPRTGVQPSEVSLSPLTQAHLNRNVEIVGYGDSRTTSTGGTSTDSGAGVKRKGVSLLSRFDTGNSRLVSKPSTTTRQVICPGDSGGPLFTNVFGRRQVFGVASEVLWRGYCTTVSESYHSHVPSTDTKTWFLNNLAAWAKKVAIYRSVDTRGNYTYSTTSSSSLVFRLLDVPGNFSNATCTTPLVQCRTSRGMNFLSTSSCGTATFDKLLGYACNGNTNSQSPAGAFNLWRVDNTTTGASISTSQTEAQALVQQNSQWRIAGSHGVFVLSRN